MDPSLQVLAGGRDLVLPSQQEAARLARRMQRAFDKARPGGGGDRGGDGGICMLPHAAIPW